jgi:hypothetical protein
VPLDELADGRDWRMMAVWNGNTFPDDLPWQPTNINRDDFHACRFPQSALLDPY